MTISFGITWEYRCPFARVLTQHVITGLRDGAEWDVTFIPFSQVQAQVEHGDPDIWDQPERDSGLLSLQAAVAVRDDQPDVFLDVHSALFEARHAEGRDLREEPVLRAVLTEAGADSDAAFAAIGSGAVLETIHKEHEAAAVDLEVWGVPTMVSSGHAAFVRIMEGPGPDPAVARHTVERLYEMLVGWPELNEFKHTSVPR